MYAKISSSVKGPLVNTEIILVVVRYLVLLDEPLPLLVHVDAAVLAVVDLVVPHYRVAVRADLYSTNKYINY